MDKQRLMELAGLEVIEEARLANQSRIIVVIAIAPGDEGSTVIGPFKDRRTAKSFVKKAEKLGADHDYEFEITNPDSPDNFLAGYEGDFDFDDDEMEQVYRD